MDELDKCILVCSNCHDEVECGATVIPNVLVAPVLRANRASPRQARRRSGRPASS